MPDQELALWFLDRMTRSEEWLAALRKARRERTPDLLDHPDLTTRHRRRLARLYQSSTDDDVSTTASTAAAIDKVVERDLLSSREEFIELALATYLDGRPEVAEGLPTDWRTTLEAARAEVEGRTSGAFDAGFTAGLAEAARDELQQERSAERILQKPQDRERE